MSPSTSPERVAARWRRGQPRRWPSGLGLGLGLPVRAVRCARQRGCRAAPRLRGAPGLRQLLPGHGLRHKGVGEPAQQLRWRHGWLLLLLQLLLLQQLLLQLQLLLLLLLLLLPQQLLLLLRLRDGCAEDLAPAAAAKSACAEPTAQRRRKNRRRANQRRRAR